MWEIVQGVRIAGRKVILPRHARTKKEMATMKGGPPSSRQVEFQIDLIPGAAPMGTLSSSYTRNAGVILTTTRTLEQGLQRATYLSKNDLRSGYHQLKVRKEDVPKIPFLTSKVEHEQHLNNILSLLNDEKLYTKFSKSMKEENIKEEALSGANEKLETGADRIKYLNERAWILKVNNLWEVWSTLFYYLRQAWSIQVTLLAAAPKGFRSLLYWRETRDTQLTRLDIIQETVDKITKIKERLKTTKSQQKSYADNHRKQLEFQVGDQVLLKVSPWKDTICFRKQGKLNPRYNGPFKVLSKVGLVTYHLDLPRELSGIHNVFHVSNLKKCLTDETLVVPLKELKITDKL
nr:putative reverse transcriptase domain-containing protein [Tanacetum cinerariifolium]